MIAFTLETLTRSSPKKNLLHSLQNKENSNTAILSMSPTRQLTAPIVLSPSSPVDTVLLSIETKRMQ